MGAGGRANSLPLVESPRGFSPAVSPAAGCGKRAGKRGGEGQGFGERCIPVAFFSGPQRAGGSGAYDNARLLRGQGEPTVGGRGVLGGYVARKSDQALAVREQPETVEPSVQEKVGEVRGPRQAAADGRSGRVRGGYVLGRKQSIQFVRNLPSGSEVHDSGSGSVRDRSSLCDVRRHALRIREQSVCVHPGDAGASQRNASGRDTDYDLARRRAELVEECSGREAEIPAGEADSRRVSGSWGGERGQRRRLARTSERTAETSWIQSRLAARRVPANRPNDKSVGQDGQANPSLGSAASALGRCSMDSAVRGSGDFHHAGHGSSSLPVSASARLPGRVPGAHAWLGTPCARQAWAAPNSSSRMVGWAENSSSRQEDLAKADHGSLGDGCFQAGPWRFDPCSSAFAVADRRGDGRSQSGLVVGSRAANEHHGSRAACISDSAGEGGQFCRGGGTVATGGQHGGGSHSQQLCHAQLGDGGGSRAHHGVARGTRYRLASAVDSISRDASGLFQSGGRQGRLESASVGSCAAAESVGQRRSRSVCGQAQRGSAKVQFDVSFQGNRVHRRIHSRVGAARGRAQLVESSVAQAWAGDSETVRESTGRGSVAGASLAHAGVVRGVAATGGRRHTVARAWYGYRAGAGRFYSRAVSADGGRRAGATAEHGLGAVRLPHSTPRLGYAADPVQMGGVDWRGRVGGDVAQARLERVRPPQTTQRYNRWQTFWRDFCSQNRWDPLTYTLSKWHLFAGWLSGYTQDRDLGQVRSALNRMFDDAGRGRPFKGVDVSAVIDVWASDKDAERRAAGEEVGLHRVPCPEVAIQMIFEVGRSAVGQQLGWCALLVIMMLGLLRGASLAGFQSEDVKFDRSGVLVVLVRYVKRRPQFKTNPGVLRFVRPTVNQRWIAARDGRRHVRDQALDIVQRALQLEPSFVTLVSDRVTPAGRNGEDAAALMTQKLRELCPASRLGLAQGTIVACHSIREMGAVVCYKSGRSMLRTAERGFWRSVEVMWSSYIEPYLWFPDSPWLAELYDDIPGA